MTPAGGVVEGALARSSGNGPSGGYPSGPGGCGGCSSGGRAQGPLPGQPGGRPGLLAGLAGRIERFFAAHRDHLRYLHFTMFCGFLAIIVVPLFLPSPTGKTSPFSDYVSFANYALWGLWFPLVFLSVIFSGRSWCGVLCPMGAAAEWANGIGPKRAIPRWLRWEGTPVISFLIITILGQTLGVRDHASGAAELFGGTMGVAVLTGFLYGRRKRAWCRHACPIGLLLGVFSRLGAVDFKPRNLQSGGEGYTERGACPTMIDLPRKTETRHCIECFRCVNPQAKGGIHLELRRPGAEVENIRDHHANAVEVWFLFLATGIALGGFLWLVLPQYDTVRQILGEWVIDKGWLWLGEPGPAWLVSHHPDEREVFLWLDFFMITGFMLACSIVMAALLGTLTALSSRLARLMGGDSSFGRGFTELGYQYAPVAMVSLVVGLGAKLFEPLGDSAGHAIKGGLFLLGLIWSIWLGERILSRQGISFNRRWLPLLPGVIGSLAVGVAWAPAIFGL